MTAQALRALAVDLVLVAAPSPSSYIQLVGGSAFSYNVTVPWVGGQYNILTSGSAITQSVYFPPVGVNEKNEVVRAAVNPAFITGIFIPGAALVLSPGTPLGPANVDGNFKMILYYRIETYP